MQVQQLTASMLSATGPYAPVAVEQYGPEQRRYFDTDRPDKLNMRIVSPTEDHRFYLAGRPDHFKEVRLHLTTPFTRQPPPQKNQRQSEPNCEQGSSSGSEAASSSSLVLPLEVVFSAGRSSEGAVAYRRQVSTDTPQHLSYVLTLLPTTSTSPSSESSSLPFTEIVLTLAAHQVIDVPYGDSAASLWRERKILHLGVKYDAVKRGPGGALEVYQDHAHHSMRVTLEDPVTLLPKTVEFDNEVPNNSELYEDNKIALLAALRVLVNVEREMYVRVSMDPDSITEERERIAKLTLSLFDSADQMTRQPAPI